MHATKIQNSPALALLLCSCGLLYAQYPGPADNSQRVPPASGHDPFDWSIPDSNPAIGAPTSEAFTTTTSGPPVSAAELRHPLSEKVAKMLYKAQQKMLTGKQAQGLADLHKALKEPAAAPYVHSILGAEHLRQNELSDAVAELEQAVEQLPIYANYSNLGYALCLSGDVTRGEQEIQRALQMGGPAPEAHFLEGLIVLDELSRTQEACDLLRAAESKMRDARIALAVCYTRSGDMEGADQKIRQFAGQDQSSLPYWKSWVDFVARFEQPSMAFGFKNR